MRQSLKIAVAIESPEMKTESKDKGSAGLNLRQRAKFAIVRRHNSKLKQIMHIFFTNVTTGITLMVQASGQAGRTPISMEVENSIN